MPLAQTITVFNKSGKVVSTSKQLVNVWKEAKAAYRERKAEIAAVRTIEVEEKHARKALKHVHIDQGDNASRSSSRASRSRRDPQGSKSHRHGDRSHIERGYTDSFYANEDGGRRGSVAGSVRSRHTTNHIKFEQDFAGENLRGKELIRRHTDGDFLESGPESGRRHSWARSTRSSIDMDLAYGELPHGEIPPPLPVRHHTEEVIMREKMTKITMLLDEANALQHSVTSMIEHLQKNPDAMAAVALTLAEVSNLAAKMGPGALMALKGSFPAVVALLASPQFLIAGGLAIGVTVVMLGGYKIVQRIKDKKEIDREMEAPFELQELETGELDRIEVWRRGIADAAAQSAGSTVDGEFITPGAEQLLIAEGVLDEDSKSRRGDSKKKSSKTEKEKKKESKHRPSSKRSGSSRAGSTVGKDDGRRKKAVSGLKMLFQGHSIAA